MPLSVYSAVNDAYQSHIVTVEGCFLRGFTGMQLLGNIGDVAKNGLDRARTALESQQVILPQRRTVISLCPADIRKDGNQFDLALAVCMFLLARDSRNSSEQEADENKIYTPKYMNEWLFVAELGLDGALRPVRGVVGFAVAAMNQGIRGLVVAEENAYDLEQLRGTKVDQMSFEVAAFSNLRSVLNWVEGDMELTSPSIQHKSTLPESEPNSEQCSRVEILEINMPTYSDMVLSDDMADIAVAVAAGFHNILLAGTPGCGKSMFMQRLPSLLPDLEGKLLREAMVHQSLVSTSLPQSLLAGRPPLRMPHHQTSAQAVLGTAYQPGEMSLAHGGVLFLDEFCEFRRDIVEGLREPLESGYVTVSRAAKKAIWKAKFLLAVALNNCPCGWMGSRFRQCQCSGARISSYRRKLSGPILDRIDIHYNVPEPDGEVGGIFTKTARLSVSKLHEKVMIARAFGRERNAAFGVVTNNQLHSQDLLAASKLSEQALHDILTQVIEPGISYRAVVKGLKVARTLADMDESDQLTAEHLQRAWSWQAQSASYERADFAYGG